jgi:hypothetical protein
MYINQKESNILHMKSIIISSLFMFTTLAFCAKNYPLLSSVEVCPAEDIIYIPPAVNGVIAQDLILKQGAAYTPIPFVPHTASITEPDERSQALGASYAPLVEMLVARFSGPTAALMKGAKNRYYSLICTDFNGIKTLYPRLRFSCERTSGDMVNRNQLIIRFSQPRPMPGLVFSGEITNV